MLGISNFKQVFPTTPKALKGVLQTKNYSLIKSLLVMDDIDNILRKKRLLCSPRVQGTSTERLLLPAFSHLHVRDLSLGFGPKEWKLSTTRVVGRGVSCGGREVALIADARSHRPFRLWL